MPFGAEIWNAIFNSTRNSIRVEGVSNGTVIPTAASGKYNATPPTLSDGATSDLQLDANGNQKVVPANTTGTTAPTVAMPMGVSNSAGNMVIPRSDATNNDTNATSGSAVNLQTIALGYGYNGSVFTRNRANEEVALLASASRTTTQTGSDITNYNGNSSLVVVLDMTTVGTGSVTLSIEGKDTASGKYYTILTGAAVATNSTNRYKVSPTITAVANSIAQDVLPRVFRITVTANNANAATYSVGYCLIRG